ncbi:MAPEG family protein [Aquisalimonas asiatica]|uniref:MAPEG family protein n=1 Tax=Aquisalimonas asiatica TaxID=406100 RepID=UPI000B856C95|nr:MAPEG family protein [Aquisalimonas asiatica]
MPHVTILYAGLLGILSLVLSALSGRIRGKIGASVGDGGSREMLLSMRRHSNFVEYVPLALLLIALLEMNGVTPTAIHIMGAALVICRIFHAAGLRAEKMNTAGRFIGHAGTFLITLIASVWAIAVYVGGSA